MAQYIPKEPLVVEIENRIKEIEEIGTYLSPKGTLTNFWCYINTLEVKEVDLDKEIDTWYENKAPKEFENVFYHDIEDCAKYFFELGLSVINPITAADRGTAEEIIINLKRVEKDYRINLAKEMEWLRNKVKKG